MWNSMMLILETVERDGKSARSHLLLFLRICFEINEILHWLRASPKTVVNPTSSQWKSEQTAARYCVTMQHKFVLRVFATRGERNGPRATEMDRSTAKEVHWFRVSMAISRLGSARYCTAIKTQTKKHFSKLLYSWANPWERIVEMKISSVLMEVLHDIIFQNQSCVLFTFADNI